MTWSMKFDEVFRDIEKINNLNFYLEISLKVE